MKKNRFWKVLGIVCTVGIVFVSGMAIGGSDENWIQIFLTVAVGIVILSFGQYYSADDNIDDEEEYCKAVKKHWHLSRRERRMEEID